MRPDQNSGYKKLKKLYEEWKKWFDNDQNPPKTGKPRGSGLRGHRQTSKKYKPNAMERVAWFVGYVALPYPTEYYEIGGKVAAGVAGAAGATIVAIECGPVIMYYVLVNGEWIVQKVMENPNYALP